MDVRNDFKFNKIENEVKRKFVLHKHIQQLIQKDLQNKVKPDLKPKKGRNTYMFGDNRLGKCGLGSLESFVFQPQSLFAKFKRI